MDVSNEVAGKVTHILFKSGQLVQKGQLLIKLDSSIQEGNLQSAQGKLPATKANYQRMQRLYRKGSVSQNDLDQAKSDYESLLGTIESYKAEVAQRNIRAPFDGVVGIRNVFLGEYLSAGTNIVRLEDNKIMRINFSVPQTDISKIHLDQPLQVTVDSYPNHPFNGTISAIEPAVNKQSGVVSVQAGIPNTDGKLVSGMFAQVAVKLPVLKDQILVPQNAISFNLYGQTLFVLKEAKGKDGKDYLQAHQVLVKVAERKGNDARIASGVKAGDMVVTSGQVRLSNGSHVRIVKDDTLAKPDSIPML